MQAHNETLSNPKQGWIPEHMTTEARRELVHSDATLGTANLNFTYNVD